MGCRDAVHYRPWGVVGIIGTWNYPLYLNVGQIAQAIVAGNAVLWKPSENAPRTAEVTQSLFRDCRVPGGVDSISPRDTRSRTAVSGSRRRSHCLHRFGCGRAQLAARLGERLIPSTLELSGCDAMFVLADANIEMAARAAWFGLTINRGQTCIAVRRIFVQRAQYEAFVAALKPLLSVPNRWDW